MKPALPFLLFCLSPGLAAVAAQQPAARANSAAPAVLSAVRSEDDLRSDVGAFGDTPNKLPAGSSTLSSSGSGSTDVCGGAGCAPKLRYDGSGIAAGPSIGTAPRLSYSLGTASDDFIRVVATIWSTPPSILPYNRLSAAPDLRAPEFRDGSPEWAEQSLFRLGRVASAPSPARAAGLVVDKIVPAAPAAAGPSSAAHMAERAP